jgi:hypothetical protein
VSAIKENSDDQEPLKQLSKYYFLSLKSFLEIKDGFPLKSIKPMAIVLYLISSAFSFP